MTEKYSSIATFRYDLVAGLTVALVAIPQALAYAELAGIPAYVGIYALSAAAIAAAFFASSPHLQVGPAVTTSLLTLGVLATVAPLGSATYMTAAALLALIVGVVRVMLGLLGLGALAYLLAQPVLLGFVSAAALLILASQVPAALGVVPENGPIMARAFWALSNVSSWNPAALVIAATTAAISLIGRRVHPAFPGVLIAIVAGIAYSHVFGYGGPVLGEMDGALPRPRLDLPYELLPGLLVGGAVIAIIGFSEAASIARTYAIMDRRRWNAGREFISQGAANIAAGVFGGFPVGASFSRSALNRLAGAKTKWSGLVTGLCVLAFIPIMGLLSPLPKASLAGILIASVFGLLRLPELWRLRQYSRPQGHIAWITFGLTLLLAPRIDYAVLAGIGLAVAHHLRREQRVLVDVWLDGEALNLRPRGVLWFGSAPLVEEVFNDALERHTQAKELVLRLGSLGRIDLSAAIMLGRLMNDAKKAGLTTRYVDVPPMAVSWVQRIWREADESESEEASDHEAESSPVNQKAVDDRPGRQFP